MDEVIIGVDLGGTRLRAARLDPQLTILERRETPTNAPEGPDAVIARMIEMIRAVWPTDGARVIGIGVSSVGPLDPASGIILAPPNLPGWHVVPLGDRLRAAFDVPIYIGNDANVAVLAEVARGAARGCKHAIYVTLSTGIGGGVMADGRLLLGRDGFATEIGYMVMLVDDQPSYLETEAAGPALAKQARERITAGEASILRERVGGDLEKIDSRMIGEAAAAGDALALDIVRRAGRLIGLGMVTLLQLFNPEIIVIGGGVSNIGDLLFEPMHAAIRQYVTDPAYLRDLRIERSALGEDVSIIGAAALVRTQGGFVPLLEG